MTAENGERDFASGALSNNELLRMLLEKVDKTATKSDMHDVRQDVKGLGDRMGKVESCVAYVAKEQGKTEAKVEKIDTELDEMRGRDRVVRGLLGALWALVIAGISATLAFVTKR